MKKGCPEVIFPGQPFYVVETSISCEREDVMFPKEVLLL
jgi:hypothetical protein